MATTVQFRRANTLNTASLTGANGEITIDTDKKVVVVHDGVLAGGYPLMRADDVSFDSMTVTANVSANAVTVGANVAVNTSSVFIGNSSVNSVLTSSSLKLGNSSVNTTVNSTAIAVTSNTLTLGTSTNAANGYTYLPNGFKLNWGWVSANSSAGNATFTSAYSTNSYVVTATSNSVVATYQAAVISTNSSVVAIRTANATSTNVYYMAIGV